MASATPLKSNFRGDHTVWCKKCNAVVMMRDCPDSGDAYLFLSGTQCPRDASRCEALPPEFARPEVAEILAEYYQPGGYLARGERDICTDCIVRGDSSRRC